MIFAHLFLGPFGFDSGFGRYVSRSSIVIWLVNLNSHFLIGDYNYALAA